MNHARAYAHILSHLHTAEDANRVISYMKHKGHRALLPRVLRILLRVPDPEKTTLFLARMKDGKAFRGRVTLVGGDPKNLHVVVDQNIVGGFMVRKGSALVDATFRRSLVKLYKKILSTRHG